MTTENPTCPKYRIVFVGMDNYNDEYVESDQKYKDNHPGEFDD